MSRLNVDVEILERRPEAMFARPIRLENAIQRRLSQGSSRAAARSAS